MDLIDLLTGYEPDFGATGPVSFTPTPNQNEGHTQP